MKLVPIALVALSLLVGCSDPTGGGEKMKELEQALKAQEQKLQDLKKQEEEVVRLQAERDELQIEFVRLVLSLLLILRKGLSK